MKGAEGAAEGAAGGGVLAGLVGVLAEASSVRIRLFVLGAGSVVEVMVGLGKFCLTKNLN